MNCGSTPLLLGSVSVEATAVAGDGLVAECAPFAGGSVSEVDLRRLRAQSGDRPLLGHFTATPVKQLLYYFSEGLLDGAIIGDGNERDIYRLAETAAKPLYLTVDPPHDDDIAAAERLAVTGLCFSTLPAVPAARRLRKPALLRLPADVEPVLADRRFRALAAATPLLVWCPDIATLDTLARWRLHINKQQKERTDK